MASLAYFLIFAALFALMMRFGCGAHVMGHGHDRGDSAKPATGKSGAATDPVCGMTVDTATARTATHAGKTYYFCSAKCQERFVASPETYLRPGAAGPQNMEQSHGKHSH